MNVYLRIKFTLFLSLLVIGAFEASTSIASPGQLQTLTSFTGTNGANPYNTLWPGTDGSFYGVTFRGGSFGFPFGYGTVFKFTAPNTLLTLNSFDGTNGSKPIGGLIQVADGNLYGTTTEGGSSGLGTVFRVSTNGNLAALISFTGNNGASPAGRLTAGPDGFLYGTTQLGGASNSGTIFRIGTNGTFTSLAQFSETNGANPYGELALGWDGNFYGTTVNGGMWDLGSIFRVATNGALTTLLVFDGTNGANPYGGLVRGEAGDFYGTTAYGGNSGAGTIFRITTNGTLTTLHSFTGGVDGANPWASLVFGSDGFLYGTTILGGRPTVAGSWGTVFQITTNGNFSSLHTFSFDVNGVSPYGSVAFDDQGFLYGMTFSQGAVLRGTIFSLRPAHPSLIPGKNIPGFFQLSWDTWLGQMYQPQYATNLVQAHWTDWGTALLATTNRISISDPVSDQPMRFYRVNLVTP